MNPWVCKPCAYDQDHAACWDGQRDSRTGKLLVCGCDHERVCLAAIRSAVDEVSRQLVKLEQLRRAT